MADVYRHRRRRAWSVRVGGRVVGHRASVCLVGVVLRASEAGRVRCLDRGSREVVAWARGELADLARPVGSDRLRYRLDTPGFRAGDEGRRVSGGAAAWFEADGTAWIEGGRGDDDDLDHV
ncbi:hypothetical protein ASG60_08040 [Methylobacterium sp. Leaf469]|nr:hypothetical protein ASG60_08040 [Methylobacterium sp. Leaf469]